MPTSQLFLSNDAVGTQFGEEIFRVNLASTTSATATSAVSIPAAVATKNGKIVGAWVALNNPALSASGFVSGTVSLTPRINSVAAFSIVPSIDMVATSALVVRTNTLTAASAAGVVKGTINPLSAQFSAGDTISFDYNMTSAGSAAAGFAGAGFIGAITVRYDAV